MGKEDVSGTIIYCSSTGSTKESVDWMAEEIGFEAHGSRDSSIPWEGDDTVVIGVPILASKPSLGGRGRKNWVRMEGKSVDLFTTCEAHPAGTPVQGRSE